MWAPSLPITYNMSATAAPIATLPGAHLESERHNQIRSRNARLGAIRCFFRLVAVRDPASMAIVNRVLAIPTKRTDQRLVTYLTRVEMDTVLAAPGSSDLARAS
jgi:hypothetical protein